MSSTASSNMKEEEDFKFDYLQQAETPNTIPKIGLSSLATMKPSDYKRGTTLNLMVAGSSGSGKTTFINTLFDDNYDEVLPTNQILVKSYEYVEENGFTLTFNAIDTPGYGLPPVDNQFAWLSITDYIDEKLRVYLFQNEQPDRSKVKDDRVHVCLYFLVPGVKTLLSLDITAMQQLSTRVNLIPVISKSDILSLEEIARFKDTVNEAILQNDIRICNLITDQEVVQKINQHFPFSVIGSTTYHKVGNQLVRGRKYTWGVAEVDNEKHCDFKYLKEILMGDDLLELVQSSEFFFEIYRSECLETRLASLKEETDVLNGLQQLKLYHQVPLKAFEESLPNPILESKKAEIKESLLSVVNQQETRFKQWKKALIDKQDELNADIATIHDKLLKLKEVVHFLQSDEEVQVNESSVYATDLWLSQEESDLSSR